MRQCAECRKPVPQEDQCPACGCRHFAVKKKPTLAKLVGLAVMSFFACIGVLYALLFALFMFGGGR